MLAALVIIAILLSLFVLGSPEAWRDETMVRVAPFALAAMALPIVFVWHLFKAPAAIHAEQNKRILEFENSLVPRVRLYLAGDEGFARVEYGIVHTMVGGHKQVEVRPNFRTFLVVACENISNAPVEKCEAYITGVRFEPFGEESKVISIDSIAVPWIPLVETDKYSTDIPPGGHRTLVPLAATQEKVYFHSNNVPAKYIHTFDERGVYVVTMAICLNNSVPIRYTVKLDTSGKPTAKAISEG